MPNITQGRLRELERAEKELQYLNNREAVKPFVKLLIANIGTLLASMPYEMWPDLCKEAFRNASRNIPTGAQIYKSMLPETEE